MSGELVRENNFIQIFYGDIFHSSLKISPIFYAMKIEKFTKIEKFAKDSMVKEVIHSRTDADSSLHFLSIVSKQTSHSIF